MKKNRLTKYILFLLIALFALQLVPCAGSNSDGIYGHEQNSGISLSSASYSKDVLLAVRVNPNISFQNIPVNYIQLSMYQMHVSYVSLFNSFFQRRSFDYRKVIRQSIPLCFNGSKYKSIRFAV